MIKTAKQTKKELISICKTLKKSGIIGEQFGISSATQMEITGTMTPIPAAGAIIIRNAKGNMDKAQKIIESHPLVTWVPREGKDFFSVYFE